MEPDRRLGQQAGGESGQICLGREPVGVHLFAYAKGRHSLIRATMVWWTRPALPRLRFRLAFLEEAKWRKPGFRRSNLPDAVNLNRFAAAFLVFRRAMDLGMGRRTIQTFSTSATPFLGLLWFSTVVVPKVQTSFRPAAMLWSSQVAP